MKVFCFYLSFLCFVVNGQYFSEGWKPGQAVTNEPSTPLSTGVSGGPQGQQDSFSVQGILDSPSVSSLFAKVGVNISSLASAAGLSSKPVYPWDTRIPMITDTNFDDIVVNEELTPEEEENRTWLIVVSASATSQGGGISQFVDKIFDETYNETLIAGDMPDLRWGRIDYLNVTYLTTKWGVWQAPTFVILQNRGQTLRFIKPQWLRLGEGALREFLTSGTYNEVPPWDSSFAPGGSNEYFLHYFSLVLTKIYNVTIKVPRWILYILSGSVASFVIQLLHRPSKKDQLKDQAASQKVATASTSETSAPASTALASGSMSNQSKAKQRKSKK
ncbi:hypothetical protein J3R30DRAFT_3473334 [Lentinula aciculospora]|uniref:Thioredoxin domain-containing protein n=1 Tax=Lentinula aciculospora TaxID=153920 RepID=A0A9W9ABL7_9AGAR|nr:hypothetical protein J3R30DRAFT_3473334 [Lentinula aciculospora]